MPAQTLYGPIDEDQVVGRPVLRVFPLSRFGMVE